MTTLPTTRYDAVIVGAGIIGCAIALEMSRSGYRTVNVDANKGPGQGPTSSSAGIIRTFASQPFAIQAARTALPIWHSWKDYLQSTADETELAQIRTCGSMLLDQDDPYAQSVRKVADELHLGYELWSSDDIQERLPFLDLTSFGPPKSLDDSDFWEDGGAPLNGGLFFPDSGYVSDPLLATENIRDAAERAGATFLFGSVVTEVRQGGGRAVGVRLGDGSDLAAPVVINATGVKSDDFNALAGVLDDMRIRTRVLRQELHHVQCPPSMDYDNTGIHIVDADLGINFRPEIGNSILVGSNGASVDKLNYLDDAADFDPTLTRDLWETYTLRLARRIPDVGVPNRIQGVSGPYDVSDDWIPIYDKSSLPGFYMAIGTSGNQFKTAPIVGRLMTRLVEACESGADHDTAAVEVSIEGVQFDMGAYSRLRHNDTDSERTVNG